MFGKKPPVFFFPHTVISLPFPTMSNDFPTNRSIKLLVEEHRPPTLKFSPKASTNSAHLPTAAELEYYSRAPRPGGIRIEFDASLLEEILSVGNDSWLIDPPALNDLHWASLIDGHAIFARSEIICAETEDLVPLIRQQGFFLANLVLDPSRNFFQPQVLNHASGSSSSSSSLSSSLPRRVRWDKHRSSQPGGRGDCRLLLDDGLVTIPVVMVEVKLPSVLGIEDVLDGMGKVAAEGINLALSPDANTLVATMGLPHSFSQTIAQVWESPRTHRAAKIGSRVLTDDHYRPSFRCGKPVSVMHTSPLIESPSSSAGPQSGTIPFQRRFYAIRASPTIREVPSCFTWASLHCKCMSPLAPCSFVHCQPISSPSSTKRHLSP